MERIFTHVSGTIATMAGRPLVFLMAAATIIIWGVSGPFFGFSDTWQLVINTSTTIITFLMVFLIQNSQNRDAAAMQAKLDELIRSVEAARDQFIGIEHLNDREIDRIRAALEHEAGEGPNDFHTPGDSVERLLNRR